MTGQLIYILLVSSVITDLAYSTPKLQRRKIQTNNFKKIWARQGLPESVESTEGPIEIKNNILAMKDDKTNSDQPNEASENSDYANDVINENSGSSPENNSQQADSNRPTDPGNEDDDQKENPSQHNDAILDRSLDEDFINGILDEHDNEFHEKEMTFPEDYVSEKDSQSYSNENGEDGIDKEVEEILERRLLALRPQKLSSSERIESLADYFNKIVIAEQLDENNTPEPESEPESLETTADRTGIPVEDYIDSEKQEDASQLGNEYDATPEPPQESDSTDGVGKPGNHDIFQQSVSSEDADGAETVAPEA